MFTLCDVNFSSPLTPQDIKDGKLGTPTYTELYRKGIDPTIQTEHTALTNAICDKLFGTTESTVNNRYIIENATSSTDKLRPGLNPVTYYTVIEVTDTIIKERVITIWRESDIAQMVSYLSDSTKYRIDSAVETSYAIMGEKLLDNDEILSVNEKTPLGDKVTDAQLLKVLNDGYKAKYIGNGYDESWYINRDKDGNIINATLMYYEKSETRTYYRHYTLTFCGTPFTYDDYLRAEEGIYQDVACVPPRNGTLIEDTSTVNLHPALVQAAIQKCNVELSDTKKITYVSFSHEGKLQTNINGEMVDAHTLRIYIMEGEQLTNITFVIKVANSDVEFIANLDNGLYSTRLSHFGTSSITPDGEKLLDNNKKF